jgi:MFS family permease
MQITLSKNNIFSRYYRWVFRDRLPMSLCPFFWTMIFLIVLSPIILTFKLAMYIQDNVHFPNKPRKERSAEYWKKRNERNKKTEKLSTKIGKVFFGLIIAFNTVLVIIFIVTSIGEVGWIKFFIYTFSLIGLIGSIVGVLYAFITTDILERIGRSPIIQIPVHMISAVYHKMCPIINWVDKTEEQ